MDVKKMDVNTMTGAMLAFVGDAYYSLKVREMLMQRGINKSEKFHRMAIFYVSANAQAMILDKFLEKDFLSTIELDIVRRGRNVKSNTTPKKTTHAVYSKSTAFEALIGYLYLNNELDRLDEIMTCCFVYRQEDETNG